MKKWAYYNENNAFAAAWLRELIKAGHIAEGEVDERSIKDVDPRDTDRFVQVHWFAGIGGWSYALRLAGWPDDEPVWTGSCPCQPFSVAGKKQVDNDERHLWPAFREAIAIGRPSICFGEQVASKDGRIWLAGVRTDLEELGYVVGASDLCAAGISAPMVSQRLHWVAAAKSQREHGIGRGPNEEGGPRSKGKPEFNSRGDTAGGLPAAGCSGREKFHTPVLSESTGHNPRSIDPAGVGQAHGYHEHWWSGALQVGRNCIEGEVTRGRRKYRAQWRIKPGLSLLAHGIPGRVGQLCGFGNAIVPQLAAEFILAAKEAIEMTYQKP